MGLTKIILHTLDFNLGTWSYEWLSKQKTEAEQIITHPPQFTTVYLENKIIE